MNSFFAICMVLLLPILQLNSPFPHHSIPTLQALIRLINLNNIHTLPVAINFPMEVTDQGAHIKYMESKIILLIIVVDDMLQDNLPFCLKLISA